MKFSFNILRPLIFVCCGLGYLPLQSADHGTTREISSIKTIGVEKKIIKTEEIISSEVEKTLN